MGWDPTALVSQGDCPSDPSHKTNPITQDKPRASLLVSSGRKTGSQGRQGDQATHGPAGPQVAGHCSVPVADRGEGSRVCPKELNVRQGHPTKVSGRGPTVPHPGHATPKGTVPTAQNSWLSSLCPQSGYKIPPHPKLRKQEKGRLD